MAHGFRLIGVQETNRRVFLGTADTLDDARAEAAFYVEDPRDTIQAVYLWDVRDEQYRGWVTRPRPVYKPVKGRRHDQLFA